MLVDAAAFAPTYRFDVAGHGPTDTTARAGTVPFMMRYRDGRPVDDRRVEELAHRVNISLRTGCFCNPDAMRKWFVRNEPLSFLELRERRRHRMRRVRVRQLPNRARRRVEGTPDEADIR